MTNRPKFTAYITKYALTTGIQTVNMVAGPGTFENYHGEGKDWHRTMEGAIARAEVMRKKKIASLHRAIKKLEAMTFPPVDT
jgi:hypothetical protein